MLKLKDILVVFAVFATPFLQLALNISGELSFSMFLGDYNLFYTEILYFIIFVVNIFILKKSAINKVSGFIFSGLLISFLSCWVNGYNNWFGRFLIGADFYLYGLIFTMIDLNRNQIRIIRFFLLALFGFICIQITLIAIGVVDMDKGSNMGELTRFGSTAGSSIQSGFLIFMLIAVLTLLYQNRFILMGIYIIGILAILFSLSRGPILSLILVSAVWGIIHLKRQRNKIVFLIVLSFSVIYTVEKQFNFLTVMEERNNTEDITGGREDRWITTIDIYKSSSSFSFGAGNGITPSERRIKSNFEPESNLSCSPHNTYLSFLVENGILGIINFVVLMIVLIRQLIKKNEYSFPLLIFLSLPLIMMNTEIILRNGIVAFFFWFLYYLLRSSIYKTSKTI